MSDTNAPKAGSVTPPSAPEGMEPFQLSAGQRNKLFVSLMVGFFLIFACYASVGAIFMPAMLSEIDNANKENNLAIIMSVTAAFTMFIQPIRQTAASARIGSPAPRFCPTRVAAALDMPQAGISVNIMMRMAMVAPATASVETLARMRMRKIHAVMATII